MMAPMHQSSPAHVLRLINIARQSFPGCQTHGYGYSSHHLSPNSLWANNVSDTSRSIRSQGISNQSHPSSQTEYAFEVSASHLRFGDGSTKEVGLDLKNMKATKVGVFTDSTLFKLKPMKVVIESLSSQGIDYQIFDQCKVEPNQESWEKAIEFARASNFSHFLAVGGGSVIDTCKTANLFSCYPQAGLLDFVNAPIGEAKPIDKPLKPLIAIPTTAGTGSETTGTAIFDYTALEAKTGIANRALRPTLGIVDPVNTESCPRAVHINSGLDVLFHALESYTAIPYDERTPRPSNPLHRPAYQGRNPISDVFSLWALETTIKYLPRVARDPRDHEARSQMLLASTFAGIGFGNAGVHLCHGFSYPISGLNKKLAKYDKSGYQVEEPLIPHGLSVAITGPSVFKFTSISSPDRHQKALELFLKYKNKQMTSGSTGIGLDELVKRTQDPKSIGLMLYDQIVTFLIDLGLPRGLNEIGYSDQHIDELVKGTLPQRRVLDLSPIDPSYESLSQILKDSMKF